MKVILIDGGIGKNIALTGVVKKYAEENEVIVVSSHPWVFHHIPGIIRTYDFGAPYLFEDVIKPNEVIKLEPYEQPHTYRDRGSIIESAAKMLWEDMPNIDELKPVTHYGVNETRDRRNVGDDIFFQPFGAMGADGIDPSARSMPLDFAHKVADELIKTGKTVWYVGTVPFDHPGLNVFQQGTTFRQIMASIKPTSLVVGVDSSLHHAAVAADAKPIVFWGSTNEKIFGYQQFGWSRDIREHKCPDFIPIRLFVNDPEIDEKIQYSNKFGDYAFSEFQQSVL